MKPTPTGPQPIIDGPKPPKPQPQNPAVRQKLLELSEEQFKSYRRQLEVEPMFLQLKEKGVIFKKPLRRSSDADFPRSKWSKEKSTRDTEQNQKRVEEAPESRPVESSTFETVKKIVGSFVRKYDLTEDDLSVLSAEFPTARELSEAYQCSLEEAEQLLEALDSLYTIDSLQSSQQSVAQRTTVSPSNSSRNGSDIAYVEIQGDGSLYVQPTNSFHYVVKWERLQDLTPEELQYFYEWVYPVNERLNRLPLIVKFICEYQSKFLCTGDYLALKPLTKSAVADAVGIDNSSICRYIRGKTIRVPYSLPFKSLELSFLCQSSKDVMQRVIDRVCPGFAPLTEDHQKKIRAILYDRYGLKRSARTIRHHRFPGGRNPKHKPRKPEAPVVRARSDP
jgi:hypothetical protein